MLPLTMSTVQSPAVLEGRRPRADAAPAPVPPRVAVVIPVHNESDNIAALVDEVHAALADVTTFEIVVVDDASSDETPNRLAELAARYPRLRALRHRTNCGQSAAMATAIRSAAAPLIATLDGDGQNDPADIPRLLQKWDQGNASTPRLLAGWRTTRRDNWLRRISSKVANAVRGSLLGDRTPDTGCGLKLFERATFLALPYFDHMHRFLPALVLRNGGEVISVPVRHRPRQHGRSHYGVLDRLFVGIVDIAGVLWLRRRFAASAVEPIEPSESIPRKET